MAAPVMGDGAESLLGEVEHVGIPRIRVERPAVRKGDNWTLAPILVENFGAVLRRDGAHGVAPASSGEGLFCSVDRGHILGFWSPARVCRSA